MREKVFALLVYSHTFLKNVVKILSNWSNEITITCLYLASRVAFFVKCATCKYVYIHSVAFVYGIINIIGEAVIIRVEFYGMELNGFGEANNLRASWLLVKPCKYKVSVDVCFSLADSTLLHFWFSWPHRCIVWCIYCSELACWIGPSLVRIVCRMKGTKDLDVTFRENYIYIFF